MKWISGKMAFAAGLLLAMAWLVSGCGTTSSDPVFTSTPVIDQTGRISTASTNPTTPPKATTDEYRFRVGDMVVVNFSGGPEPILPHEERVKEDGNITLPLIGAVKAKDKTSGELQTEIHDRYVPKYYVRLTVIVKPPTPELLYYVTGEVRSPGPRPLVGTVTVTKAISAAGGMTDFARRSKVLLKRAADGTKITVDYDKAIQDPALDPQVYANDSINVPKHWF